MNINRPHAYPSVASDQRGAVLIVVLLFLMLIMLVGVIAVRNSSTDLKLATSDQINTVLLQSSDSVNNKIEMSVNAASTSAEHKQIMGYTGIFGYYILNESANDDIINFCYRPRDRYFNIDKAAIQRNGGILVVDDNSNEEGYCNPEKLEDYTSARNTTMTQVMIKNVGKEISSEAFGHINAGADSTSQTAKTYTFEVYSTSVLPSYSNAKTEGIYKCFKKGASGDNGSVAECMLKNNVPNKMIVQQVDVANIQNSEYCSSFGSGTNTGTTSQLCRDS